MTPAPGPLSPPASGDGLTNEASGSRGHYFTTTNTNADASSSTASTVRATSRERPSLTSASAAAAAAVNTPKTCSGCGRLLESSSPPNERAGTPSTGPSPSSIAFATNPGAVNLSSITAMLANTPAVREAMELEQQQQQQQSQQQPTYHIDQDGHPMCVFCFNAQQRAERFFRANATPAHTIPDPDGMNVEQSSSAGSPALPPPSSSAATTPAVDQDGDSRMSQDAAESQRAQSTDGTAVASSVEQAALPVSTPTRSVHPWRRPAPWANGERTGDSPAGSPSQSDRPPLRISVGNMGAGGDAVPAEQSSAIVVADTVDDDFPPLPRSPHANGGAAATSPRPHLSPTRSRIGAVASSPGPPAHVRHASFSRSLSATGGLGGAGGGAGGNGVAPVVNFPPTRGRHRASSGSGTVGSTMLVGPSVPSPGPSASGAARVRRPSATRRLSRSSSSQGPTATSFADFGEVLASSSVGGSAVAEDGVRGEPIAEDPPFGPMHMTRPRLSTLEPWDIVAANAVASAAAAAGSYAQSGKMGREHARTAMTDVHRKPFVAAELLQDDASMRFLLSGGGGEGDKVEDVEERRRALQQRYLTWLDSKRPDPRIDVTRIRFASLGRGCLFSGSTFRGTQKSGRMSYDVTVQILNVDLAASHLCGYLNIRGLTDDWPELTTYFDAEIIGQRYGFVTGKWGATEADDLKHWSRFTPFRPIRSSLTRPGLRFNHMNKPFIFMRWKERFLVPDHRVRDISGASFAGFYYVCVELGEDGGLPRQSLTSPASPTTSPGAPPPRSVRSLLAAAGDTGEAGAASTAMEGVESAESASEVFPTPIYQGDPIAATSGRMSGFYFHEHSEPYQQLTLRHVADPSTSTYELR